MIIDLTLEIDEQRVVHRFRVDSNLRGGNLDSGEISFENIPVSQRYQSLDTGILYRISGDRLRVVHREDRDLSGVIPNNTLIIHRNIIEE